MNSEISEPRARMFDPIRAKRRMVSIDNSASDSLADLSGLQSDSGPAKRTRSQRKLQVSIDAISDKENFHRWRPLAPRSRSAKILLDLVVDLPTDCTDYEVSEYDGDDSPISLGEEYLGLHSRMHDEKNKFYHFKVFEDPTPAAN